MSTESSNDNDSLDTLQALFPALPIPTLQRYLAAAQNDLQRAFSAIERNALDNHARPRKRQRTKGNGGLDSWLSKRFQPGEVEEISLLSDSDGDEPGSVKPSPIPFSAVSAPPKPIKSAYDALRPLPSALAPPPHAEKHINLPPLLLTNQRMLAEHTQGLATLVENALPPELAAKLYVSLVEESLGEGESEFRGQPWQPNKWWLVDREVTSPHTSAFYRELPENLDENKGYDKAAFDEAATHWYNGAKRTSRPFTSEMDEARELIGVFVRTLLQGRERHVLEWQGQGGWEPNVAAANCYRGKGESVGWHSDALRYLGPMPTIASLTLGVGRPFRLRPFLPSASPLPSSSTSESSAPSAPASTASSTTLTAAPTLRTLEIHLPHNSLLIMHAGVQETYKHCVPSVSGGMDLFRIPRGVIKPDSTSEGGERGAWIEEKVREVEGKRWRERINMTFRHYRPDFAPLPSASSSAPASSSAAFPPSSSSSATPASAPSGPVPLLSTTRAYAGTPLCPCGVPCTLRPDGKGRVRARQSTHSREPSKRKDKTEDEMIYFWTCNAGAQNEGKGCGMWRVLNMEKEGRGKWFARSAEATDVI
ncbi:hypothetical protein JCM11641_003663 [Rhodosporidiobolus odoratus]